MIAAFVLIFLSGGMTYGSGETFAHHRRRNVDESSAPAGLHILAGSPEVGKSWLALWLAVAVAKGEFIWGMRVKCGTTLYLCLEDSQLRGQNQLFDVRRTHRPVSTSVQRAASRATG